MTTRSPIATFLLFTLFVSFPRPGMALGAPSSEVQVLVDHARDAVRKHVLAQPGSRIHGELEAMPIGDGQVFVTVKVSVGRCATATKQAFVFDPPTRRVIPTDESVELPRLLVAARMAVREHLLAEPGTRLHGEPKVRLVAARMVEVEAEISTGRCGTPVTIRLVYEADSGFISPVGP